MLEVLKQPWPWYIVGPLISLTLFLMLWLGESFGMSSTFKTACAAVGGGNATDYFKFDWKKQTWNIIFAIGGILGAFIATFFLSSSNAVAISQSTITDLQQLGIPNPGNQFIPTSLFSWQSLFSLKGFIIMVGGGFLVGFGTRYAEGCTSGHSISGLSNLQLPSLIATIGFFIGGIFMTYLILPYILKL